MSEAATQLLSTVVAAASACWAGLFALAGEARSLAHPLGHPTEEEGSGIPLWQAMQACHMALLVVAGAAASQSVGWWHYAAPTALGRVALALALVYMVASGLPRGLGAMLPALAERTVGMASSSVVLFQPLIGLLWQVEARLHSRMPAPERATDRYGPEHHEMLDGAFSLSRTTVEEAMTPRLDVEAVSASASWSEVVEQLRRSDHARLPVYTDDLDSIVGILYAKDLTPAIAGLAETPESWQEFVRPAAFVPESKTLTAQLRDFQRGPSGLAIVVDEFGGTSGLITLEDVLEEVVGEIYGEYDEHVRPAVEREGDDKFWIDGSMSLDDLADLLGIPVENEGVTTVGGLVYSALGHVPKPGEELEVGPYRVVVEQVVRRRIRRVYFERVSREYSGADRDEDQQS